MIRVVEKQRRKQVGVMRATLSGARAALAIGKVRGEPPKEKQPCQPILDV